MLFKHLLNYGKSNITRLRLNNLRAQSFNSAHLGQTFDKFNLDTWNKLKDLFKDDIYKPRYNISLSEERELAYNRLSKF